MEAGDPLGHVEFAVLDAVHRRALRSRSTALQIHRLRERRAGEGIFHDVLHRCEQDGLLRSQRDDRGRRYELTAAGRARLRADRRFRVTLVPPSPSGIAGPRAGGAGIRRASHAKRSSTRLRRFGRSGKRRAELTRPGGYLRLVVEPALTGSSGRRDRPPPSAEPAFDQQTPAQAPP